jgi:hypothetical protein
MLEVLWDERVVSRKDPETLSLIKRCNKLFLHPHPASPIKGEEFFLPSPGGRD